jgi:hypothetical protein
MGGNAAASGEGNGGRMSSRDRHHRNAVPVGAPGHVDFLFIDERFIRYRCTDRNCPERKQARARGNHAYHWFDIVTHRYWVEEEPIPARKAS